MYLVGVGLLQKVEPEYCYNKELAQEVMESQDD